MFEIDVDETKKWWIVKKLTFTHLLAKHLPIVGLGNLLYDVAAG